MQYALKVLAKFRLLEWQRVDMADFLAWGRTTPYFQRQHALHGQDQPIDDWLLALVDSLIASGAAQRDGDWLLDR